MLLKAEGSSYDWVWHAYLEPSNHSMASTQYPFLRVSRRFYLNKFISIFLERAYVWLLISIKV